MKLKLYNIITALLIATYVYSSIGVSVFAHYCGGELEQISLFSAPKSCCGGDEADMEDGCCKNEKAHLSFKKDFSVFKIIKAFEAPVAKVIPHETRTIAYHFITNYDGYVLRKRKIPPPKLVQQRIVACSVIRI